MQQHDAKVENNDPAFINEVVRPINAQDGDLLPVSAFKREDKRMHTCYIGYSFQDSIREQMQQHHVFRI